MLQRCGQSTLYPQIVPAPPDAPLWISFHFYFHYLKALIQGAVFRIFPLSHFVFPCGFPPKILLACESDYLLHNVIGGTE